MMDKVRQSQETIMILLSILQLQRRPWVRNWVNLLCLPLALMGVRGEDGLDFEEVLLARSQIQSRDRRENCHLLQIIRLLIINIEVAALRQEISKVKIPEKLAIDTMEPRRSNRRIQPISRKWELSW